MIPLSYSFTLVKNTVKETVDLIFLVWEAGSTKRYICAHLRMFCCTACCIFCLELDNSLQLFLIISFWLTDRSLWFCLEKMEGFLIFLRILLIILQYVTADFSTPGNCGTFHSIQKSFYIGWVQPFLLLTLINIICLTFEPCISQSPRSS